MDLMWRPRRSKDLLQGKRAYQNLRTEDDKQDKADFLAKIFDNFGGNSYSIYSFSFFS